MTPPARPRPERPGPAPPASPGVRAGRGAATRAPERSRGRRESRGRGEGRRRGCGARAATGRVWEGEKKPDGWADRRERARERPRTRERGDPGDREGDGASARGDQVPERERRAGSGGGRAEPGSATACANVYRRLLRSGEPSSARVPAPLFSAPSTRRRAPQPRKTRTGRWKDQAEHRRSGRAAASRGHPAGPVLDPSVHGGFTSILLAGGAGLGRMTVGTRRRREIQGEGGCAPSPHVHHASTERRKPGRVWRSSSHSLSVPPGGDEGERQELVTPLRRGRKLGEGQLLPSLG